MTIINTKPGDKNLLFLLAFCSSLSSAGTVFTLMSLSASFLIDQPDGLATAAIQTCYYAAIALTGLIGGAILQKFSSIFLGILGPLISAFLTYVLSTYDHVPTTFGLIVIFIVFMLNGIEHPNLLRYFNIVLNDNERMTFFTLSESITSFLSVFSPALAAIIIIQYSVRFCFQVDSFTYLLSCIPWIFLSLRNKNRPKLSENPAAIDFFGGFHLIIKNRNLLLLNLNRMLNNIAYVTWSTIIPLILVGHDSGKLNNFTSGQGFCNSLIAIGFIFSGIVMTMLFKKTSRIVPMIVLATGLGFGATVFLLIFQTNILFVYLCAFCIGFGTYCFRMTGMTLGPIYTPKEYLGPVIIASDTIVRGWSFLISVAVIFLFYFSQGTLIGLLPLFSILSLSLLAPIVILNRVRPLPA